MNNFNKFILSTTVIGFLSLFVLTTSAFGIDVPSVPTAPDKPHPSSPPEAPSNPNPSSPPSVPTLPSGNGGVTKTPTPTTKPNNSNDNNGNSNNNDNHNNGIGGTNGDNNNNGGNGDNDSQVKGLSNTSGENTDEIILMLIGLSLAGYGIKEAVSKKLKI